MSANREHHDDTAPAGAGASRNHDTTGTNAGRRRILQAGLGAAPVILTLTSKPAFAQTMDRSAIESMSTCMSLDLPGCEDINTTSVSSLQSYYSPTPSNNELKTLDSSTTTTESTDLTLASTDTTTTTTSTMESTEFLTSYSGPVFATIFGTTWGPATGSGKWKGDERFGDVLWMDTTRDPQNFAKLLVAAYLNASSGTYTLDLTQVVTMGQRSLAGLPYYLSTTSTVSWDQSQVIKYLTNTIPL